ncbi:unnamed protein product (macronuclear) [Paramecium tetraurelia]|uniref:Uncharacterized protein n=1 Tax=Paramecium tetraurelia TaxID=5888 RepID=A0DH29_PARTE|nr:uncharacterized protein GSPATT00016732001 [Paramecium tetraurelia]CAK82346.1 unnamed protein product [Paramecium tetraurelia]|eukprot:XP_001449743.1 hypothetical protein (macronuclear) [Paramecium tetraurelia strain d4-2]
MNQSMAKLYSQDGTGRDSYIFCDNGGFYPGNFKLQKTPQHQSWAYGTHSPQKTHFKPEKRQFYISDGTGRDTYVIRNVQDKAFFSPDFSFQLRKYDSQIMNPQYPYKLPPLKQAQQSIKSDKQKSLIQRLAKPKLRTQSD